MSNSKRLKWLGPVRLRDFKACAWALGRALHVPHCGSLDALAQSCGWLNYRELTLNPDLKDGQCVPVSGSAEEIYDLWCQQAVVSYGLRSRAEFDAIERLPSLFRYVLAPDAPKPARSAERDRDDEDVPRTVRDPMLRAGDWRDAEFRQWVSGIVDRSKPKRADASDARARCDELKRLEEELE